jgi:hypothetical protein
MKSNTRKSSRDINESRRHILTVFKETLISFLDELIDQFPHETNLILARIFLKDQIPIERTMRRFILKLEQNDGLVRKRIQNKDENFFLENNIFSIDEGELDGSTVSHFRNIWLSNMDVDDREIMWQWCTSFVVLSQKYQELASRGRRHVSHK